MRPCNVAGHLALNNEDLRSILLIGVQYGRQGGTDADAQAAWENTLPAWVREIFQGKASDCTDCEAVLRFLRFL
jgi:hypothetical protein